jgi:hypothetical protein
MTQLYNYYLAGSISGAFAEPKVIAAKDCNVQYPSYVKGLILHLLRSLRVLTIHYTKTAQFRRSHLFSSVHREPTKTSKLVCRLTKADEIALIFVGLGQADENATIVLSA